MEDQEKMYITILIYTYNLPSKAVIHEEYGPFIKHYC